MIPFATFSGRQIATSSAGMAGFLAACFLPICAPRTSAQPPERRVPGRATIPEVTLPGLGAGALNPVDGGGLLATVTERHIRLSALIARLRAKELSPQSAWQSGDLSADDLLYALSTPTLLDESLENEPVRLGLAGLLIEHGAERLPEALKNARLKRWIAYYFAGVPDARAVPLLEELLAEIRQPAPNEAEAVRAIYLLMRLSGYYEKAGDANKAAETLLRAEDYARGFAMPDGAGGRVVPIAGMVANRLLDAAQLYQRAGQPEKARELYARIAKYGYGWATGAALLHQAIQLVKQHRHTEARELLQTPVQGLYADQVQVALLSLLGRSYRATGNLEEARRYSKSALQQYQALKNPLQNDGLEAWVKAAQDIVDAPQARQNRR